MGKTFTVDFVSPVDFEYLAAEISFDDQIICRVSVEREDESLEIDFFNILRDPIVPVKMPLTQFCRLLNDVGDELLKTRRNIVNSMDHQAPPS